MVFDENVLILLLSSSLFLDNEKLIIKRFIDFYFLMFVFLRIEDYDNEIG